MIKGLVADAKKHPVFVVLALIVIGALARSAYGGFVAGWTFSNWSSFAELLVLCVGLISLWFVYKQLQAQTVQSQKDLQWKQVQSFYEHFSDIPSHEVNERLHVVLVDCDLTDRFAGTPTAMTAEALDKILAKSEHAFTVKAYLDVWEGFAGAVNCGLVDRKFAYDMECGRVVRTHTIFLPFIERQQRDVNARAYIELCSLAEGWAAERLKEDRKQRDSNGVAKGTLSSNGDNR